MTLSQDQLLATLEAQLTQDERARADVYVKSGIVGAGTMFQVPRLTISVPSNALIAFIDRQPAANWGHECRYVLVMQDTGDVQSFEGRFPPWGDGGKSEWKKLGGA